jgi:1,4-dihydroxy-2-naphthoyl-CoA hydrolase
MSIWFRPHTLAELALLGRDTMVEHIGIEVTELGDDFIAGRMPVDRRTLQPYGLLHGGASMALAETLGSYGAALTVDPERQVAVGVEINANHLRSARSGWVHGIARPVYLGGRTQVWSIDIRGDDGQPTCVSRLTVAIMPKRTAAVDK